MEIRKNLVLLRCGDTSLHRTWLGRFEDRTWDLVLYPYQNSTNFTNDCGVYVIKETAGYKFHAVKEILNNWPLERHWSDYEFIWIPDDDVFVTQEILNEFFNCCAKISINISALALHEKSYFAHFVTMHNRNFIVRETDFVEVMIPCFSKNALRFLFETFDLESTGQGWGLDYLWAHMLGYKGIYIIDALTALHTRPIGSLRSLEQNQIGHAEINRIIMEYKIKASNRTRRGLQKNFVWISGSDASFLARLINGWNYLIDAREPIIHDILYQQLKP